MVEGAQDDIATSDHIFGKWLQRLLFGFFAVMIITFLIFLPTYLYFLMTTSAEPMVIATNPITGVFIAFFLSTFVVLFLKYSAGPIEFEGLTFRFKGASGPVVLWALVFLVIMTGLWALAGS